MIKISKYCVVLLFVCFIGDSYQQYWDNVNMNRFLWAAMNYGLDPNSFQLQPLEKQTISSTNTENNGLGAFIGSYKENSTNSDQPKPEPVTAEPPKPETPKPETTNPPPPPTPPSNPKPPVESNDPPSRPNPPEPAKPVENKENPKPPNMGMFYPSSAFFFSPAQMPQFHPLIFNQPMMPFPFPMPSQYPSFQQHLPVPVQLPVNPKPNEHGAFAIQQPTITMNGETIVENLIGGLNYNCVGRATGHYRDTKYCDVFHACVFGQQRKTYSCPFVGEPQYFDDATRRCEFVRNNPLGCASNAFYN